MQNERGASGHESGFINPGPWTVGGLQSVLAAVFVQHEVWLLKNEAIYQTEVLSLQISALVCRGHETPSLRETTLKQHILLSTLPPAANSLLMTLCHHFIL